MTEPVHIDEGILAEVMAILRIGGANSFLRFMDAIGSPDECAPEATEIIRRIRLVHSPAAIATIANDVFRELLGEQTTYGKEHGDKLLAIKEKYL